MNRRKFTTIKTETLEQWVVRHETHGDGSNFCERCGSDGRWLSIRHVQLASHLSPAEILRYTDSGQIHSYKTAAGRLLICGVSLGTILKKGANSNEK